MLSKWWNAFWDFVEEALMGDKTMQTQQLTPPNPDVLAAWDSQKNNYHNVRVLCDLAGLPTVANITLKLLDGTTRTVMPKDIICACVYQESEFLNYYLAPDPRAGQPVKHENLNKDGFLASTDWGIAQINDYYHVKPTGSPFSSVAEVLANPQSAIQFMIICYTQGALGEWDSYKTGSYLKWLEENSPMWTLA